MTLSSGDERPETGRREQLGRPSSLVQKGECRRLAILGAIISFSGEHQHPPTWRELADLVQLSSLATVHSHLKILREQGHVSWEDGQFRTLTVTESGMIFHKHLQREESQHAG